MKKTYIQPNVEIVRPVLEYMMIATSIQNTEDDVQHGIEQNTDDNFEAGSNGNNYGWDNDEEW